MKRRFTFYWVRACPTPEGKSLYWVPSRRQWLPEPDAVAIAMGPTAPSVWLITFAFTLRRALWIARRSSTGATIERMKGISVSTEKRWVIPAPKVTS